MPLFLLMLLFLVGCTQNGPGESVPEAPVAVEDKGIPVAVEAVTPFDLREPLTLPGSLEAWEDLLLAAEIDGPVRWRGPEEGERVRAGEPLLRIDSDSHQAALDRARSEAELRTVSRDRLRRLLDEKLISPQEYDNAVAAQDAAAAELRQAQVALEKSTLYAPISGVLDRWLVDRGEYVSAGMAVAELVQVDRLKVLLEVPEKDIRFLALGEKVHLTPAQVNQTGGEEFSGEIIHLAYKADPVTRTYMAKVEVANNTGRLRPGMIVRVSALRRELPGAIAIPLHAVVDQEGRKLVYVAEDGAARQRDVRLGPVIDGRVVVEAGLNPGEALLVKGQHLVNDGSPVVITEP
ncbi:efflux RND transporter periplasmic adaptor subunit [Trichloromonas sp.]|uniref:efflux RND transporter periplasmic adaptor subunit n=1 Tax=Trichloromonas sp. TaxID=3069249 RepID=UPI002A41ACF8|nr:efflux RND transporter periplasmic adaptor subunit [Trichloromonas sp.]